MLLAEGFKLFNGFGYAVCAAHQMFVDRTAVGAFFVGILYKAAAVVAF